MIAWRQKFVLILLRLMSVVYCFSMVVAHMVFGVKDITRQALRLYYPFGTVLLFLFAMCLHILKIIQLFHPRCCTGAWKVMSEKDKKKPKWCIGRCIRNGKGI